MNSNLMKGPSARRRDSATNEIASADGGRTTANKRKKTNPTKEAKKIEPQMMSVSATSLNGAGVEAGSAAGVAVAQPREEAPATAQHRPSGLYGELTSKAWREVQPPLSAGVLDVLVSKLGFERMTPVQAGAIPLFLSYKDVCVEVTLCTAPSL